MEELRHTRDYTLQFTSTLRMSTSTRQIFTCHIHYSLEKFPLHSFIFAIMREWHYQRWFSRKIVSENEGPCPTMCWMQVEIIFSDLHCLYISLKFLTIKNSQLATSDDNGLRHKNSVNSVDNINSSHEMIMSSLHMTLGLRLNSLFYVRPNVKSRRRALEFEGINFQIEVDFLCRINWWY